MTHLVQIPRSLPQLPVRIAANTRNEMNVLLGKSGKALASHFAQHTTLIPVFNSRFVHAGQAVMTVESFGKSPRLDLGTRIDRHEVGPFEVLSFRLNTRDGFKVPCYWIESKDDSRAAKNGVRALRVHLLRLHSIGEFMRSLISHVESPNDNYLVSKPGDPYDKLQLAITTVSKVLQNGRVPSVGSINSLLPSAFQAHNVLEDNKLDVLEQRLLSAARPSVQNDLESMKVEILNRRRVELMLGRYRDRSGVLNYVEGVTVNNYDFRGANVGAAGDHASATNFSQQGGPSLRLGQEEIDSYQLVADLRRLRDVIQNAEVDEDTSIALEALNEAEEAARAGDGAKVRNALSKTGKWLLKVAENIGTAIAAAAIKTSIGL
ncbi:MULTISPECIES: hypothetical protein [Paenarthrobacter]|uniref:Uncharacterized protein n=1 Tax=Paenarthrobacter ureafaciens TaxID=37931 RepID=A0AAX3ERE0_PAEUR|nr:MULTISPECIES: hypothetical protein [Paenarthrobacter]MCX8456563.1 hypothetical protein [Paenarthrobacter ureafaciens]MCY0974426.1 hypothetical protein [Paenarthrobacter ureafaciens]MDO5866969.1 hypothetical protein [Paenarthrobacter sp. SD-2]MDO5877986.1 hypothetical protein [Paenarthrobacter sp. SD-1]UYV95377.1 hypothetical protein NL395_22560 [Paenarthrobacter ureafaciens]